MQHREAVGGRGLDDRQPERAAADRGDLPDRVDVDVRHGRGADDHHVVEPAERAGVVSGALRCDPQPGRHRRLHELRGLDGVGGVGDGGGALVDGDVPGGAGVVEPGVSGQVDGAAAQTPQRLRPGAAER